MKSPKFLKWIRTLECYECGALYPDGHHLPYKRLKHTRRYCDVGNVVNLCRECHQRAHKYPNWERNKLRNWRVQADKLKEIWGKYELTKLSRNKG